MIEDDTSLELEIEFDGSISQLTSDYYLIAEFTGGCSVMFDGETNQAGNYESNSGKDRDTFFPGIVGADQLHLEGLSAQA